MSHTLHRRGEADALRDDYVLLIMAGKKRMENEAVRRRMGEAWDILGRYEADLSNYGSIRGGGRHRKSLAEFKEKGGMILHAVFREREALRGCLEELRDRELGLSVAVSACDASVRELCAELGLTPHTVQHSLGTIGKVEKLPSEGVLEISTMCGHAMVSPNLIAHVVARIGKGNMTHAEAASTLSGMCDCGVFNPARAERLLREMV